MGKLEQFKLRARAHGQDITIYAFAANPSGDSLDPYSGEPDPEDADYPGTVPAVTEATAVTVTGFVQVPRSGEKGTRYARSVQGEEVPVDLVAFVPGDQAITVRDRIVYEGVNYSVMQIGDFRDGSTVVFRECLLRKATP
jgi:hypothetical protein